MTCEDLLQDLRNMDWCVELDSASLVVLFPKMGAIRADDPPEPDYPKQEPCVYEHGPCVETRIRSYQGHGDTEQEAVDMMAAKVLLAKEGHNAVLIRKPPSVSHDAHMGVWRAGVRLGFTDVKNDSAKIVSPKDETDPRVGQENGASPPNNGMQPE